MTTQRAQPPWAISIHPDSKKPDKIACSMRHGETTLKHLASTLDGALAFAGRTMPTLAAADNGTLPSDETGAQGSGTEQPAPEETGTKEPPAARPAGDIGREGPMRRDTSDPLSIPDYLRRSATP